MRRKHISWKTKCAALVVQHFGIPYTHAKQMTETQVLSLVQWDHGIFHETQHPERDKFWNIEAKLIREHREKTKKDQGIIAKSRRIRKKLAEHERKRLAKVYEDYRPYDLTGKIADALVKGFQEGCKDAYDNIQRRPDNYSANYSDIDWNKKAKRKIPSRVNPWPPRGSRRLRSRAR